MPRVKLTKEEWLSVMRPRMRAEGCDCTAWQWDNRGMACTKSWIRCNGRFAWKKANCPKFQRGLERLGKAPL